MAAVFHCQKTSIEDLKCTLNVHCLKDESASYQSFLNRVKQFRELSSLPTSHHLLLQMMSLQIEGVCAGISFVMTNLSKCVKVYN